MEMSSIALTDDQFMQLTIEVALRGSGFVNPRPLEGVLLVGESELLYSNYRKTAKSDEIIVVEAIAHLKQVIQRERNITDKAITKAITMYINIEPDAIFSQDILSDAKANGVDRIVVGLELPLHGGEFSRRAEAEGIQIIRDVCYEACRELNEIYYHYVLHKTPFVFVKWAMSLDGKLATKTGDSKWISSEGSLNFVHRLRQRVAAIMVGEGTVKMDDPRLNTRLDGETISNPLRVIVTRYGQIPDNSHVLDVDKDTKTLLVVSDKIPDEREQFLLSKGVQIVKLPEVNGHLDFVEIVILLGELGIDSLYIEGGSSLLGDAFESGVVHKVYAAIAPKIIGGKEAYTPVGGSGIERMAQAIELKRVTHEIIGQDVIIKGYI